jgi:hypothetical protein
MPRIPAAAGPFGRAGLVELTVQLGLENMRARTYHALGIIDQGFDAACGMRPSRD